MPTTARDIITLALKETGVLGVGQTALDEDINDCLTLLGQMTAQWQKKRWLIPALVDYAIQATGVKSYTIGSGGDLDIVRPSSIKAASVIQLNTGSTPVSLQLTPIFSYEDYLRISVKDLHSLPDHFFYDNAFAGGVGNFYPWPIPDEQYQLHLLIQAQLNFPNGSLDTVFELPLEYQEAIYYNLAIRMSSMYQYPVQDSTKRLAKASLNTIKTANTQIPELQMPVTLQVGKAFNIFNADGY